MKIKSTSSGFVTNVNIGRNAFFITLDEDGVEVLEKELFNGAMNFNYVVIRNIYKDAVQSVNSLIKKLLSSSPKTRIEVNVGCKFLPPNAGSYERVLYNAYIGNEIEHDKKVIKWLKDASSNFIFNLSKETDLDYINTFARKHEIDKSKVILILRDVDDELLYMVKLTGYNVSLDVGGILNDSMGGD